MISLSIIKSDEIDELVVSMPSAFWLSLTVVRGPKKSLDYYPAISLSQGSKQILIGHLMIRTFEN